MAHNQQLYQIKSLLQKKYNITDLGRARQYLGIELEQTPTRISLSQARYIHQILRRFGLDTCNGHMTPLESGAIKPTTSPEVTTSPEEQRLYQSMLGSIMYVMMGTRLDLAFTVSILSKHSATPQKSHLQMAKRALRYL
jgi:hypothetical protein